MLYMLEHTILNFWALYFSPLRNKILPNESESLENGLLILDQIHFLLFNNKEHAISIVDEFT
jgi:hypothetical protein